LFVRAEGGRDAERNERQLWETPERKRSTKQIDNGNMNESIIERTNSYLLYIDLMGMRRHYLGDRGENTNDIQKSEHEISGSTEHIDQSNETIDKDTIDTNDEPPLLEDIQSIDNERSLISLEKVTLSTDNTVDKQQQDEQGID
jgi:hypothetical protein